jgi:release factor glutamine methyltransferase
VRWHQAVIDARRSGTIATLRAAGCVFAEDEAALLISAAGTGPELDALVAERAGGRPLEHLLGWAEFGGRRIAVDDGVFVPRRRTEFLVRLAVAALPDGGVVVDLCCGSGAIGAAIRGDRDDITLHAADLDPVAVACARRNLDPAAVHQGDLFDALPGELFGRVDVLVVNAPYVPSAAIALMPPEARLYERSSALDGGPDGLDIARRIAADGGRWLAPGGQLLIETSRDQAAPLAEIFSSHGLTASVRRSEELDATVVVASTAAQLGAT